VFLFLLFLLLLPVLVFLAVLAAMFFAVWAVVKLCLALAEVVAAARRGKDATTLT
jgi:hypothetical protein